MGSDETFGSYLRQLREGKGLSLRQAAEAAQVSSGYLSQIEGGKRGKRKRGEHFAPHPQILRRLADVYHVPAQELFERAGFFERQEEFRGFSEAREVDRCFDLVIHDPALKRVLSTPDKRAIIERYEALSGRRLITWAGDYSEVAKRSDYKGLALKGGVLYAETGDTTLTLEEVARELAIDVDVVQQLVRDKHLRLAPGSKDLIEKAELREFKFYLMGEGLRLTQARDRQHQPRTPEDRLQISAELAKQEWDALMEKARRRGTESGADAPQFPLRPKTESGRRSKTPGDNPRASH